MEFITSHLDELFAIIGIIVTLATAIVAMTPTKKDDEILGKIVKFLDYFSVVNRKKDAE